MDSQPKLEQILDHKILMYMAYTSSFEETMMMNFLAIEAFNTVNQTQTKEKCSGGEYIKHHSGVFGSF